MDNFLTARGFLGVMSGYFIDLQGNIRDRKTNARRTSESTFVIDGEDQ